MKELLKITLLLIPFWASAQTVQVYVNDSTFTQEPIRYTGTDSVNGTIKALYTNHNNALAYEVNFYYGHRSGLVKMYYPSGKLMRTVVYARGLFNGETAWYDENGQLVIKGIYVKGVKDGYWAYRNYGFMGRYSKGLKNGWWKYRLPDGTGDKIKFKKGQLLHPKKGSVTIPAHIPALILKDGVTAL